MDHTVTAAVEALRDADTGIGESLASERGVPVIVPGPSVEPGDVLDSAQEAALVETAVGESPDADLRIVLR